MQQQAQKHPQKFNHGSKDFETILASLPLELIPLIYSFCLPKTKVDSWLRFVESDELLTRAFYLLLQRVNVRFVDYHDSITLESYEMTNFMKFNEISDGMKCLFVEFLVRCIGDGAFRFKRSGLYRHITSGKIGMLTPTLSFHSLVIRLEHDSFRIVSMEVTGEDEIDNVSDLVDLFMALISTPYQSVVLETKISLMNKFSNKYVLHFLMLIIPIPE
ncbi:unnamed protein product [Ambrosiozyma monospora]|uniref:Unnamed protein product n=1 Tax=Ambrosiozyma monospora TaxID=43982 RepID=A0ACB5SRN4_AMBMO|nr:unnamed protein product [Ambrosiozyma monospora]